PVEEVSAFWQPFCDFPALDAPLLLKASLQARGVARFCQGVLAIDPAASLQAHAGSGIVYVQFSAFPASGLSRTLVGKLQPLAAQCGGHVVVLKSPGGQEMTHQSGWGSLGAQLSVMQQVKQQFGPRGL